MTKTQIIQDALNLKADDIWGAKTDAAVATEKAAALERHAVGPVPAEDVSVPGMVDPRSEANIATLHPKLQPLARELIKDCLKEDMLFKITSGTRSYEEQAILRQKYEAGGPKAAPPGYSNHNFRLAFDVTEFDRAGKPIWESPNYAKAGMIGKGLGLFWGGSWGGRDQDEPHFELRPGWSKDMDEGTMIAELRKRHANGIDPFA